MKSTPPANRTSIAIIFLLVGIIVAIVMYGFVKQVRNGSYCLSEITKQGKVKTCPGKR